MDTKTCSICKLEKPLSEFYKNGSGRPGHFGQCKICYRAKQRQAFHALSPERRSERVAQMRQWRSENPDWQLRSRYKITIQERDDLLAQQGGRCGICRTDDPGPSGWEVDHDHECCPGTTTCGKCILGVLCHSCNVGRRGSDYHLKVLAYLAKAKAPA